MGKLFGKAVKLNGGETMKLKSTKGFTLIELVIVIIIIAILAIVAVPMYRNYTRRAMAAEGVSLLGSIATGEKAYYVEHTKFWPDPAGSEPSLQTEATLGVDASSNKYFKMFDLTGAAATYNATAYGSGDAGGLQALLTNGVPNASPVIHVTDGGTQIQ